MIRSILVSLGFVAVSGAIFAESYSTYTTYPLFAFTTPVLATSGSGIITSSRFRDAMPYSNRFVVSEISWWERRDRPCSVTVTFDDINNRAIKFQRTIDRCGSRGATSRPKALKIRADFMRRGGMGSSLAVCLNNNRVKGVRAEMLHPEGNFTITSQNPIRTYRTFIPSIVGNSMGFPIVGLQSPFGVFPNGEEYMDVVEEKRSNCREAGWTTFASCNPRNRNLRHAVTGVRFFFNRDNNTLEGIQPYCSNLRELTGLVRPQ